MPQHRSTRTIKRRRRVTYRKTTKKTTKKPRRNVQQRRSTRKVNSKIQSIIFSKKYFTKNKIIKWLNKLG
jgi:hypothetical protein